MAQPLDFGNGSVSVNGAIDRLARELHDGLNAIATSAPDNSDAIERLVLEVRDGSQRIADALLSIADAIRDSR